MAAPPSAHPIDPLLSSPTPPPPSSAARFLDGKFLCSSPFLKTWSRLYAKGLISLPDTGFVALIAARTGNILTAHRLARLGRLHERFRATCPCCGLGVEHLQHILFVCPCWSSQRAFFLASLQKLINLTTSCSQAEIIAAHDFGDRNLLNLILILGGSHNSLSLGKFWYSAPIPPHSWDLESPDGYRPMFLLVSHFFSSIIPLRLVLLRACCIADPPSRPFF